MTDAMNFTNRGAPRRAVSIASVNAGPPASCETPGRGREATARALALAPSDAGSVEHRDASQASVAETPGLRDATDIVGAGGGESQQEGPTP